MAKLLPAHMWIWLPMASISHGALAPRLSDHQRAPLFKCNYAGLRGSSYSLPATPMSTAIPSWYCEPTVNRAPSYSVEPNTYEHRLALNERALPRPTGTFVKSSKTGEARLKLTGQDPDAQFPVYGSAGHVTGAIEVSKPEGISHVELKVEGRLKLSEIAGGGSENATLCFVTVPLWSRTTQSTKPPPMMPFNVPIPRTFKFDGETYPLPPTYTTKLPGMPGFSGAIDYRVVASIRPNGAKTLVKASLFGTGPLTISTPFIYHPRSRPSVPIPVPLYTSTQQGFVPSPEWRCFTSTLKAKTPSRDDINVKLLVPSSRIYHMGQPIPFHVQYESSSFALAGLLPFGPTIQGAPSSRRTTRMQLMRQTTVDVRNATVDGTSTDIFRVDQIGEGSFVRCGDGPTWMGFAGTLTVNPGVTITSFRAAGLTVKDSILFTMTPPDPQKCPWRELRVVVPIRLTTDGWAPSDGAGLGVIPNHMDSSEYSIPSTPSEELVRPTPNLSYSQ